MGHGDDQVPLCPSVLPWVTPMDAAQSLVKLIWVSEPQEGD